MRPNQSTMVPPGFTLLRELGRGGLGVVVLARHEGLDRLCAVKRLLAGATPSAEAVARFRREAHALGRLDHPAIVRLYDVVTADGVLFLIMEYVEGVNLRRIIGDDALAPSRAVSSLLDVANALAHAATRSVVHRDIKPDNVFVLSNGRAKLGDFGIARLLGDIATFRTSTGVIVGSLPYMAPEQLLGDSEIGPATDVYSYAAMAYEVTVGRRPFTANHLDDLIECHLHHTPERPETVLACYPLSASDALMAGMAKNPSNRPTIDDIAAALRAVDPSSWPTPHRTSFESPSQENATITTAPTNDVPQTLRARLHGRAPQDDHTAVETGGDEPDARPLDTWIEPPVFRPIPRRRRRRRAVGVAVAVAIASTIAWISTRPGNSGIEFAVVSATVDVVGLAQDRACEDTTFDFEGHLVTNGSPGTVHVQWTSPDGAAQPPLSRTIARGQTDVRVVLRFTVAGHRPLQGAATLHILSPTKLIADGPEVMHTCP